MQNVAARNTKTPRRYSDAERAHALLALEANGGNVCLTAKEIGIPKDTLYKWDKGAVHPDVLKLEEELRKPLLERLDRTIGLLLASVPTKIDDAPLKHTTDSLQALHHVGQLIRGEPTSIPGKAELTDEQFLDRLRRIGERCRSVAANPPITPALPSRETPAAD